MRCHHALRAGPARAPRSARVLAAPLSAAGAGLLALLAVSMARGADAAPGESFPDFAADGAWCWFSDPRAVAREGRTYGGWMTADGSVEVGAWDHASGRVTTHALHPRFERDDHDAPALLILPDGRLAAFYSLHARGDLRLRVTVRPGDLTAWTPERSLGFETPARGRRGTTYAHPVLLAGEANALYVFWRGADFKPTFAVSRDLGATWSAPRPLLARPGADDTNRPYLKLCSDGAGRIDFVFTDGHPRNEPANSVYYLRYERGAFFKADGTRLGGLDDLPLDPARCDRVYDGAREGRAWIWDIATTADGHPVIAFTRLPAEDDHRYEFACRDGGAWRVAEICPAGGWFPQTPSGKSEPEPHYSGGMALDPADPFTLYTSRRLDGVFEIERWHSPDAGRTWTSEPLTAHSRHDNVRPFALRAAAGGPAVLWMSVERYVHYTDYRTALKAAGARLPLPAAQSPAPRAGSAALTRCDRPPRKVLVGTVVSGYPVYSLPLEQRLQALDDTVEAIAVRAGRDYPGKPLDLVVLPEAFLARPGDAPVQQAVRLEEVQPRIAACARRHHCYLVVPMLLREADVLPRFGNAAVLVDREGRVAGLYRKVHPVAPQGSDVLEAGITPGGRFPSLTAISGGWESRSAST